MSDFIGPKLLFMALLICHCIMQFVTIKPIPYFSGYKTELFSFQNNPKYLDPSYKMDLDLQDCFGRVKLVL